MADFLSGDFSAAGLLSPRSSAPLLLRGRLTLAVQFDQRLPDLQMVALSNEQVCDRAGGRCRHRHGGFIGLQLDQRLSLGHLIAFVDQDLDDVAAFDAFRQKRQFHSHGSYSLSVLPRG